MAEPMVPETGAQPLISNRILITVLSVVLLFVLLFILWSFRGCIPGAVEKGYTKVYSNLELSDAAKVIARLKELKIPYEVQAEGSAIAVPKDRADEARLGLAEKNLPAGGMVGWEIFNETRMGATDFDRRIQLIRAISGELSRNIRRIAGVEDARVQIVIPETRLFEVTKAPVTAAVLLKLAPGAKLKPEQISGIIHLTASSVENLKPENVTVVDEYGNILSQKVTVEAGAPEIMPETTTAEAQIQPEQKIIKKEGILPPEEIVQPAKEAAHVLTTEEKELLKLKAKEEYERQLTAKVQDILNQFYPPNGVIIKVVVEFGMPESIIKGKRIEKFTKLKIKANSEIFDQPIKLIKVFVLVDDRIDLTEKLKSNTYQTISEVVPYNSGRGDRIILKKVPFHYAVTPPFAAEVKPPVKWYASLSYPIVVFTFVLAAFLLIIIVFLISRPKKEKKMPFESRAISEAPAAPTETEAMSIIEEIKNTVNANPERIANLLRKWLTEK